MKILIAMDDSPSAMNAVEYVAREFAKGDGVLIGLVHILPNLPAKFWDEGHILSAGEEKDRRKIVDQWLDAQKARMEPLLGRAAAALTAKGVPETSIAMKFVSDSTDTAASILEEARDGKYETIVIGRSHHSPKNLLGGVAGKIANQGWGLAVTIVE